MGAWAPTNMASPVGTMQGSGRRSPSRGRCPQKKGPRMMKMIVAGDVHTYLGEKVQNGVRDIGSM